MAILTCWLDCTCGPSWKTAPPPVMVNDLVPMPNALSRFNDSVRLDVLRVRCSPSPMACAPFTLAIASLPVLRCWIEPVCVLVTKLLGLPTTRTETTSFEPYPMLLKVMPDEALVAEATFAD